MGAMQNNNQKTGKRNGSRGSVRNKDRLADFAKRGKKGEADWGGCDPQWLLTVLVGITKLGGAITFGLSRDEGAYSLTLLLDGSRETLWFNGDVDLDAELSAVAEQLDAMQ